MTLRADVAGLLSADDLEGAQKAAVAAVKARPGDGEARMLLAELSVLAGDLARAETHARLAATAAPDRALGIGVFRQHLRGLHAREAWWTGGALPSFPGGPSAASTLALRLNVALGEGDGEAARAALDALDEARGEQPAAWDGEEATDLRDLDDRLPHALEAVTAGGAYLWLDLAAIARVRFEPTRRPLDLALRRARVALRDGSAADLRLPAIYPVPQSAAERLGRVTVFEDLPGGLVAARGQRSWLVGDRARGIHEATEIVVGAAA